MLTADSDGQGVLAKCQNLQASFGKQLQKHAIEAVNLIAETIFHVLDETSEEIELTPKQITIEKSFSGIKIHSHCMASIHTRFAHCFSPRRRMMTFAFRRHEFALHWKEKMEKI